VNAKNMAMPLVSGDTPSSACSVAFFGTPTNL